MPIIPPTRRPATAVTSAISSYLFQPNQHPEGSSLLGRQNQRSMSLPPSRTLRQSSSKIGPMQQALNLPARHESLDRPLDAPRPLRLWHLLSLDAPTVAVLWSLGFAKVAGVRLPGWVPVLLALMTWCVYISDRLLDARSAVHERQIRRLRQRHRFHWQYRRIFFFLVPHRCCRPAGNETGADPVVDYFCAIGTEVVRSLVHMSPFFSRTRNP